MLLQLWTVLFHSKNYQIFLNKIETYRGYLNDKTNPLSRTGFYNIMSHMDNKTLDEYYSTIPIIQYSLYRQIDNSHEILRKKNITRFNNSKKQTKKLTNK